jgi:hypothetical protein
MTLMLEKAIYGCSYFASMLVEGSMQMHPQFEVQQRDDLLFEMR